ncbi:Brefeldin A resistance protein [Elsinoe australis]|uniref:Brefeldin A resistance protein n=1 Tax=Elsinoe australis TaxID=40998 RepID=A0A2P7Z4L9_9PEZI|nr:Brefeldin A resistance protein [Elsinoe australis]
MASLVGNIGLNSDASEKQYGSARDPTKSPERANEGFHPLDRTTTETGEPVEQSGSLDSSSEEDSEREVKKLARYYTQNSYSDIEGNPFQAEEGSLINPNSDNFKARAWVRAMLKMAETDGDNHMPRQAGISFRNLSAHGYGTATDYQKSVGNVPLQIVGAARKLMGAKERRIDILRNLDGLVHAGEMLVVLGPPGSGCSTFLKTITGETHGFKVDDDSQINYQGISYKQMHKYFRGEAIYTAEQDVHFPSLTVGDTLYFAARARAPRNLPQGITRHMYAEHMRDVLMATFGIKHTMNTKVGNDFIRGVSGGERKRVTISEAVLSGSPIQAWDNSTRGLDSANAIEFCKILRICTELLNMTAAVAIYQSPQAAYDVFDKVLVLYEGRQIFFGRTTEARAYFEKMGFLCPDRQTDADFLTSMTSAKERRVQPGWEDRVPRTPDDFAEAWKNSPERQALLQEIEQYEKDHPIGGEDYEKFAASRRNMQAKNQRLKSPYTLSFNQQIKLCLWRGFKRLKADPSITLSQLIGNFINVLVISSVFYNLNYTTESFYSRGALLFFAVLMNAFGSALEILTLYAQRPIVEKHQRYALYHPAAEAFASMLTDMPYKILNAIIFNLTLYFMTNLRREPGAFFFFFLFSFILTLVMSMLFRFIASVSRSLTQALTPTALLILAIVIYTGFAIPTPYMLGWSRWINYLDPVAYGFESLMVNEFSGQNYECSSFVPTGPGYTSRANQVCSAVGSVAGQSTVNGDVYLDSAYRYYRANKWRNLGILFAFGVGLGAAYLVAAELVSAKKSKGEVLVFPRGHTPAHLKEKNVVDPEAAGGKMVSEKGMNEQDISNVIQKQTAIFQWKNVCYDIKIKKEPRRILDHVDGWVKPGTLTALMGVSGAGKTTLLDVLATRVTMGVISGEMLVDGRQRDSSFQRKTGYVQQQDLHLETSTVREALNFSALLRQPKSVSRKEKLDYVDEVIKLLEMEEYADAVVGVPGEGLNVEQRKRLTIGVELAAKPELLLFLDEPTSGLDSQTSWSILDLLEKLKNNGQAILCTIHQPSAMLFQRFDRLLFLAKGGRTVYFGPVGEQSHVLTSYFEKNGAHKCPPSANPAEWMLEVIGAAPGSHTDIDWPATWRSSPEYQEVQRELSQLKDERSQLPVESNDKNSYRQFAAPFLSQYWEVQKRVFEQHWRTPSYIVAKFALVTFVGLFIGFSFFKARNTSQGLQNQMFGIFMLLTIFSQLVQQIMPLFVTQRALYEVRERPSKTYSWQAFMMAQILAEIPWALGAATFLFFCWYYPIGLYANASLTGTTTERGAQMWLLIVTFIMFSSTFSHMIIAGVETAENGGNIANLLFSLSLLFCGVLRGPTALPGFWIFMYRVSPFTYLVGGLLSSAVKDATVTCADNEFLRFPPPSGQTCGDYMRQYIDGGNGIPPAGGSLLDPANTSECQFCPIQSTNTFLQGVSINAGDTWRDFGIMFAYIIFNIAAAVFLYWLIRVPKGNQNAVKETAEGEAPKTIANENEEKVFSSGD